MAHHSRMQRDASQRTAPEIPAGPMTPRPPFWPRQVLPVVGRNLVRTGGLGGQHHLTGPGRNIPPYMQSDGAPLYPPLENLPFQPAPFQPQPSQNVPFQPQLSQHAPSQHAPSQHAPSQHVPSQHTMSQYMPFQHQPSQLVPFQHAPHQHAPFQHTPFHHAPLQRPPFQHGPLQHPGLTAGHLPWGYPYPAPLPSPVPHQAMTRPSVQAPFAQGRGTPDVEAPPVHVERKVVKRGGESALLRHRLTLPTLDDIIQIRGLAKEVSATHLSCASRHSC